MSNSTSNTVVPVTEIIDLVTVSKKRKSLTESQQLKKKAKHHQNQAHEAAEAQKSLQKTSVLVLCDEGYEYESENDSENDEECDLTIQEKSDLRIDEANVRYTRSMTKVSTDAELMVMKQRKEYDEELASNNHKRMTEHLKTQNELLIAVKHAEGQQSLVESEKSHMQALVECEKKHLQEMQKINTQGMFAFMTEIIRVQGSSGAPVTEDFVKSIMSHGTKYLTQ